MRPLEEVSVPIQRKGSQGLTMELPDGTKVPAISANNSFKGLPIIRPVATMAKITEDVEYDEQKEQDKEENKDGSRLEAENRRTRRERRLSERRMSSNRISKNYSANYLQPVRHDSIVSSTSNKSLKGSLSSAKLARPMSRIDIFYTGSIRNISEEDELALKSNRQSYVSIGGTRG